MARFWAFRYASPKPRHSRRGLTQVLDPRVIIRSLPELELQLLTLKADWNYAISDNRRHYLVKAIHRNRIIGRAHGWFSPNSLFVLEKIELNQQYRSRGYGTSIIQELREEARNQSCSSFIFSGVQRNNIRAIRLYESLNATPADSSAEVCEFVLTPP